MSYALASRLVGFPSSTLRVRVVRTDARYAWVVTADLQSAGVPLTLDRDQVVAEVENVETGAVRHVSGLVAVGA